MRNRGSSTVLRIYLGLVYAFLFLPALLVVLFSFNASRFWSFPMRGFTWRWYEAILERPDIVQAVRNSFVVALPTVVLAVVLGAAFALGIHNIRSRSARLVEAAVMLPLLLPAVIWAVALLLFFNYLRVPLGVHSVVAGQVLYAAPYVSLLVGARLHSLDASLEDAARCLGAGGGTVFRKIVLPHIAPALISGAMLVFAVSLSDLMISFFLGGAGFSTLPVFIYGLIQMEPSPLVNAVSTFILIIGVACLLIAFRVGGPEVVTMAEPGEQN